MPKNDRPCFAVVVEHRAVHDDPRPRFNQGFLMGFLDAFYPQSFTENLLVMLVQEADVHGTRFGAPGEQKRGGGEE